MGLFNEAFATIPGCCSYTEYQGLNFKFPMPISHRERVQISLAHKQPDRVPLDLGGTQSGIMLEPYNRLKHELGLETPTDVDNVIMGLARIERPILEKFDIDFIHIRSKPPSNWELSLLPDGSFYDYWGVRWCRQPENQYHYMVEHPLSSLNFDDFYKYDWPDAYDMGRLDGAAEEAAQLRKNSDYAIEVGLAGVWESSWFLTGFEQWLMCLTDNLGFVEAVMDQVLETLKIMHGNYLEQVGPYIDLVTLWDDYGSQYNLLISPKLWRSLVKPRLANLVNHLKSKTQACIGIHSCGSIVSILDDLVEVGIDVLNPVQVSAKGMDPFSIKARYGKNLCLWGGIDTQHLLPNGNVGEIVNYVQKMILTLGKGGGYILAAVHNIQPDVPPENIIAMFDAARGKM